MTKAYRNKQKLLELYRWMKQVFETRQRHVTFPEVIKAGFSKSTSHVSYLFDAMSQENMLKREHATPSGLMLIPPEKWSEDMQKALTGAAPDTQTERTPK